MTAGPVPAPRTAPPPGLHPDLAPLAALLGTWQGTGTGEYPTIEPFEYSESITIAHVGKPFFSYVQRTAALDDGRPLHAESGFWRFPQPGSCEIVVAHPTGVSELLEGFAAPNSAGPTDTLIVDVRSTSIGCSASAKEVTRTERTFEFTGDTLRYTFRMAAVGLAIQHHLAAELHRVTD